MIDTTESQPAIDTKARDPNQALGQSLDHFPIRDLHLKRWLTLLVGILLILSGSALILILAFETLAAIQAHGRAIILGSFPMPLVPFVLILLVGILLVTLAVRHWRDGISLFEAGMIKVQGKQERVWMFAHTHRFDYHITQIKFGGSIVGIRVKVILEDARNRRWVIRNRYAPMEKLIESIRVCLLPGLIQRSRQRLLDGESLFFHKGLLAKQVGLEIHGVLVPFDQVETKVKNRGLTLYQNQDQKIRLFKSRITDIKNLDVLIDLLDHSPLSTPQSSPK